jgi:Family of unknown function (DUF6941)
MLPFKVAAAVLCDDVRKEDSNKAILIGVYNGTVVVPELPATIMVAWWMQIMPLQTGKSRLDLRVLKDDADTLLHGKVAVEFFALDWSALSLPQAPLIISAPGKLKLQLKLDGDENDWQTIQEFEVRKAEPVSEICTGR